MGIFDDEVGDLFTVYKAEIKMRNKLLAGIPKSPKLIEAWIRSKTGVTDTEEIIRMTARTLRELGAEIPTEATWEQIEEASQKVAADRSMNSFKRDEKGIYIESRQIKAMLREAVNILYAGREKWGKTLKGPKSFFSERNFIEPDHISLGKAEPDGVELLIGHVTGPQGPRSTIGYSEYASEAVLTFEIMVLRNEMNNPVSVKDKDKDSKVKAGQHWKEIWVLAQELGLGASRSQGFGKFDLTRWDVTESGGSK